MSVSVTVNETTRAVAVTVSNERGPIGPDGETGPQGPTGATGATGATGPAGSDADVTAASVQAALAYPDAVTSPADIADWVAWIRANDIAGSDGAAITSVAPSAGTSGAFTGTATLRTGANGINNQKALSFNGSSNSLSAAAGGASLTGDFYMGVVVRFSAVTNFSVPISFGDGSGNGEGRRMMIKSAKFTFNGINADANNVGGRTTPTVNTNYFLEIVRTGTTMRIFVNGEEEAGENVALIAYSSAAMFLGSNTIGTDLVTGLISEAFWRAGAPDPYDWNKLRTYIYTVYGIGSSLASYEPVVSFTDTPSAVRGLSFSSESALIVGAGPQLRTGTTSGGVEPGITPAKLTVHGQIFANATSAEHAFTNSYPNENVGFVRNLHPSGFSAWRYGDNLTGAEMSAMGFVRDREPWGATTTGSTYLEASDFRVTTNYGVIRFIQTKVASSTVNALRLEFEEDGDIVWYNRVHYTSKVQRMKLTESTGDLSVDVGHIRVTAASKTFVAASMPTYANDAAADADSGLPSGGMYLITGNRAVFRKP